MEDSVVRSVSVAFVGIVGVLLLGAPVSAAEQHAAPTFNQDVAPILFRHCVRCHRPGQIAPMSLTSYQQARPWARAIKAKVRAREMPPWFTDPNFDDDRFKMANDSRLTDAEIETLSAWADAGVAQGEGSAPPVPEFGEGGWSHPTGQPPDLVIELPVVWQIAANGESPNFPLYSPLPEEASGRMVTATEVLPGNRAATHHIGLGIGPMRPGMVLGTGPAWPGGPITDYTSVPAEDGVTAPDTAPLDAAARDAAREAARNAGSAGVFAFYVPGLGAKVLPPGHSRPVHADYGDDVALYVSWGLHYQATGRPETARPKLGLWWEDPDKRTNSEWQLGINEQWAEGQPLVTGSRPPLEYDERERSNANLINPDLPPIPPYERNWMVTGLTAFQDDVSISEIFLHMHSRGKDATYVLTYPDGHEEVLLRVLGFNFDWQLPYVFAQPVKVPAGTTLKAITRFDNSEENRLNPAPQREVWWSEQSWDDMFLTDVRFSIDRLETPAASQDSTQGQ